MKKELEEIINGYYHGTRIALSFALSWIERNDVRMITFTIVSA